MPSPTLNEIEIEGISNDTGTEDDFLTSDSILTVFGRVDRPLSNDEVLQVSVDGVNWVEVTDVRGVNWSYDDPVPHNEDFTYLVRIVAADESVTAAASQDVRIDQTPPVAVITIDATIAGDGIIINASEEGGDIAITGTVGGDVADGDPVTLTVNDVEYTGTVSSGAFSIDVPGAALTSDTDLTIDASVTTTDAAGNSTTATDTETYTVDTTSTGAPTVTISEDANNTL